MPPLCSDKGQGQQEGLMGFPRWMGSRGDCEVARERCYQAVLDRLVCAANAETRKCASCTIADGCGVWRDPESK